MIFDGSNPTDKFLIVTRDGVGVIGMVKSIDTDKDEIVRYVKTGGEFKLITERWSDGFHGSYKAP
jgi:hypothetical protein